MPIPSIAYNIETYNDRYPGYANALRVSRSSDLLLTLSPSTQALDSEIEKQLLDFRGQPISCEAAAYGTRGVGTTYANSRDQMRTVLSNRLDNSFRFERPEQRAQVRAKYGLADHGPLRQRGGPRGAGGHGAQAGHQPVRVDQPGGRPGHALRHAADARQQPAPRASTRWPCWWTICASTAHPAGGNFMDHTTIMVFSEFSRTPLINGTGGRDHHLANSCMLMGAGVKHNYVFGRERRHRHVAGHVRSGHGRRRRPRARTSCPSTSSPRVLASANLDYSITRVEPLQSILA